MRLIYFIILQRARAAAARNENFTSSTALTSFPNIILKASSIWAKEVRIRGQKSEEGPVILGRQRENI